MSGELMALSPIDLSPAMSMQQAVDRYNAVVEFTKTIMKSNIDYGVIPGTAKPTLLKPGAEKLCAFFGFSIDYELTEHIVDWEKGLFFYSYKAMLSRGSTLVAAGIGSCNSYEKKYRWRWVNEADVPASLDKEKLLSRNATIREPEFGINKAETSGKYGKPAEYWKQFKDAIANGSARRIDIPKRDNGTMPGWEIGGRSFRIQNEDAADGLNTVQKMAQKRALIAAVLLAANASEFYTQDLEDLEIIDVDFAPVVAPAVNAPTKGAATRSSPPSDEPEKPNAYTATFFELIDMALMSRNLGDQMKAAYDRAMASLKKQHGMDHTNVTPEIGGRLVEAIKAGHFDKPKNASKAAAPEMETADV